MTVPLDLFAIRREQRRVAALMQRDVTLPHHRLPRQPMPFDTFLNMCNKFNGHIKSKQHRPKAAEDIEGFQDKINLRSSHDAVFRNNVNENKNYHRYERTVSKSLDDGTQLTRLPSITITNKVTKKVLNEKDKKKKKALYKEMEMDKEGGYMDAICNDSDNINACDNQLGNDTEGYAFSNDNRNPMGHLRYMHGIGTNLPDENMGFMVSRENTEATNSALFRIASYDKSKTSNEITKSFCTCSHPSLGAFQQCPECRNTGVHAKWCSLASTAFQVKCNHCGKIIQQLSSQSLSSLNNANTQSMNKNQSATSVANLKLKKKNRHGKRKVRVVTDEESIDSGLERSETKSSLDDIGLSQSDQKTPSMLMEDLDKRMAEGAFDFKANVSIDDVKTRLRFAADDEGVVMETEDEDIDEDGCENEDNVIVTKRGLRIYKDGVREAYVKALSAVFSKKTVMEPFYINRRISRPYVTSYFGVESPRSETAQKMKISKLPPMKIIFGKTNVDDYFPGGKMNPKKALNKKVKMKSQSTTVLRTVEEEKEKDNIYLTKSTGALPSSILNTDRAE